MLGVVEREPPLKALQIDKVDINWAPISSKILLSSTLKLVLPAKI